MSCLQYNKTKAAVESENSAVEFVETEDVVEDLRRGGRLVQVDDEVDPEPDEEPPARRRQRVEAPEREGSKNQGQSEPRDQRQEGEEQGKKKQIIRPAEIKFATNFFIGHGRPFPFWDGNNVAGGEKRSLPAGGAQTIRHGTGVHVCV